MISLGALMVLFITDKSISTTFAVTAHLSLEFMLGVIVAGVLRGTSARSCTTSAGAST